LRDRLIKQAKRIVVKVGSFVLTQGKDRISSSQVESIASQVYEVLSSGRQIILVSSGAIAAGTPRLGLRGALTNLPQQQAAAAVGQSKLMGLYGNAFSKYGTEIAQLLLTHDDLADRHRFANVDHTLHVLLASGILPIVNENDTVATEEIKFGDNDVLATSMAVLTSADLLILMTDVDALYERDPKRHQDARPVSMVLDPNELMGFNVEGKGHGRGGMASKIRSAKQAAENGVAAAIINGCKPDTLRRLMNGEDIGTLVVCRGKRLRGRRRWVGYGARGKGVLFLDEGACHALRSRGKSLLPSGVVRVEGEFQAGDVVYCADLEGTRLAKGVINYSSLEVKRIKGRNTKEIEGILGYKGYDEVMHRDHLVLLAGHCGGSH